MGVKVRRLFTFRAFKYFVAFVFILGLDTLELWEFVTTGRVHIYKGFHSATFAEEPVPFVLSATLAVVSSILILWALVRGFRSLLTDRAETVAGGET